VQGSRARELERPDRLRSDRSDCIRLWNAGFVRSADADAWIDPAIDLDSGVVQNGRDGPQRLR